MADTFRFKEGVGIQNTPLPPRPAKPCKCPACECNLHIPPGPDRPCQWCQAGNHHVEPRQTLDGIAHEVLVALWDIYGRADPDTLTPDAQALRDTLRGLVAGTSPEAAVLMEPHA